VTGAADAGEVVQQNGSDDAETNDMAVIRSVGWRSHDDDTKGPTRTVSAASEHIHRSTDSHDLSERDREVLAFERQWWKYAGSKETAVKELFDMSSTRYYQLLNALIDTPAALEHDPMLVKRLRRLRSTRQRARSARRLGVQP
jgi:hypothetical protein